MNFYEARPGMWLVEGVTVEEHERAMAGNYEPGRDEYYQEILDRELRSPPSSDVFSIWTTKEGKQIEYKNLKTGHLNNIVAMMRRRGVDVELLYPQLLLEQRGR